MEPVSHGHVPQALRVIQNVCTIASTVTVNKPQYKRIADRFSAIGEGLMGVGQDQNFVGGKAIDGSGISKDYPDLRGLLAVLRTGEDLLSQCRGIISVIFRTDKQLQAFQKIHAELDTLKAQFNFEDYRDGFSKDYGITSGTLTGEARQQEGSSLASHLDSELGDVSVPECLRIDPSDIQIGREIGRGASAKVYEATWSRCKCAVKTFDSACMSIEFIPKLQRELDFLIQLRHPYMIQMLGMSVDLEHRCSIVMEMMSCSLRELIVSRMKNWNRVVPFDFHEAVLIIKKIAYAMAFLHSRGVSHRDLKSRNVMVEEHPGGIDVKIVDFGESQFIDLRESYAGAAGTRCWMAPELLPRPLGAGSTVPSELNLKAADVYSFAMTCYEVLTGEEPFSGSLNRNQYDDVRLGHMRPVLPVELDIKLKDLIEACWDSDPKIRPNFESICCVLSLLRFKNPAVVTNLSPGKDLVIRLFKQIAFLLRLFTGHFGLVQGIWKIRGGEPLMYNTESKSESDSESECELKGGYSAISVPEYLRIKHENLRRGRVISRGVLSRVYAATWLGCIFAVKRFNRLDAIIVPGFDLQQDIDFMIELRHPHIVQLVGISVDPRLGCLIVMEMMNSDLEKLIDSRMQGRSPERRQERNPVSIQVVPFDLHEAVLIIRKIALGMAFLHSRGVVHGDLKSQNVMVNEIPGSIDVKIVNFGLSKHMDSSDWVRGAGTGFWRAPEVLPVRGANRFSRPNLPPNLNLKAVDVYSFAMTCYEVFTGEVPCSALRATDYEAVIRGYRPMLPVDLHPDLKMLIEKCWHGDPLQRPYFAYICEELQRIQQMLPNSSS